ncbi:MAG TPA: biotin/lipoate A/B protein ligase family protein [Stellaceae bacterium]|nr:biotin/lipoate A/B protein ligase family protein [Stellaceae bacterium]
MRLRVIDFGLVPALRSQAAWYGLADGLQEGDAPILTLVETAEPYVCIGLHQDADLELDRAFCAANGIAVVRRRLGGGAVLLDRRQLIFHFIFPRTRVPERGERLYPLFIEPVVRTYRDLGIAARYRPLNDIHVEERKIGGTAAAHFERASVCGGMFLFDFDGALMARVLKVPSEKFRDKLTTSLEDYVTSMRRLLPVVPSREAVKARFLGRVAECLSVEPAADRPLAVEWAAIEAEEARLAAPAWRERVGRKLVPQGVKLAAGVHLTEGRHKAPGGLVRARLLERDGRVADIELSGDFDCAPAEGLLALGARLVGASLDAASLPEAVSRAMAEIGIMAAGVAACDIAAAIAASRHREA